MSNLSIIVFIYYTSVWAIGRMVKVVLKIVMMMMIMPLRIIHFRLTILIVISITQITAFDDYIVSTLMVYITRHLHFTHTELGTYTENASNRSIDIIIYHLKIIIYYHHHNHQKRYHDPSHFSLCTRTLENNCLLSSVPCRIIVF